MALGELNDRHERSQSIWAEHSTGSTLFLGVFGYHWQAEHCFRFIIPLSLREEFSYGMDGPYAGLLLLCSQC